MVRTARRNNFKIIAAPASTQGHFGVILQNIQKEAL